MTDHPTRRLPDDTRPERTPGTGPTRHLPAAPARPERAARPCPQCGDRRFWTIAQAHQGGSLEVSAPDPNWRELILAGVPHTPLEALVCSGCGYTELYAAAPQAIDPERSR